MKKKSVVVIVLVAVLVVVFLVSSFLLFRGISQFSKEERTLKRSVNTLKNYYARKPFPSPDNVEREEKNGKELLRWMEDLSGALREGQIEPIQKTPAQFLRMFSQTRDQLKAVAGKTKTALADDFQIGFERYSAGTLPAPPDVPRLAQQLVIADQVCRIIFESGATGLSKLRREEFETAGPAAVAAGPSGGRVSRRRRGGSMPTVAVGGDRGWKVSPRAGLLGDDDLHARMRFGVSFEARQDALLMIMNALASHDMFAVVTMLNIEKAGDDVTPPSKAEEQQGGALVADRPAHPPRSQRLMSGDMLEKPMKVTMEIDVYRFAEFTSGKGA